MGLNWVEDIVSHLYKLEGYMVVENEDLPMPKTANRRVPGHSDIDVIAIKGDELIHIECQSWWGPSKENEQKGFDRLKDRFHYAPTHIFGKYHFLDKGKIRVKKIFVMTGKPEKSRGNGSWDRISFVSKMELS